jgi:hypothetical protein
MFTCNAYGGNVNVSIRGVNPEVFRKFKSEAVKEDLKTGVALTQALKCWLETKAKKKKKGSLLDLKPFDWGPGNENISERADEILYGWKK